jgi:predicted nuclease of restriction endonuclease-like RecB superfamily
VLTADLASVRRRGDELRLLPVDDRTRARVEELATAYLALARASVGQSRDELEAQFRQIEIPAPDRRLGAAVLKLVRDACVFEEAAAEDAAGLRRQVFRTSSAYRRAAAPGASFDRRAILDTVARERGSSANELDRRLFADRASALRLLAAPALAPAILAADFELVQAQAVLLRAVKVIATVRARDAATYRQLFRQLKFQRLLPTITMVEGGGYRLEIDGPFSLFQAVTRYGLKLGLALPAIAACDRWTLEADVLWGTERRNVRFRLEGTMLPAGVPKPQLLPPPEVAALIEGFEKLGSPWRIDREPAVLDLPGVGLCVPDLAFERELPGRGVGARVRIYLEVLGFWSREAVWRRVDLVRAGLPQRILFAVSRDLRVSEDVLSDSPSGALYVFSRVLNARAVLAHLDRLIAAEPGPV